MSTLRTTRRLEKSGRFMHIGILQTGHVAESLIPEHGDYDSIFMEFLAGRGLSFTNFSVVDGVFPKGPTACDGWLITGSKHGAYEKHAWIPPLEDLIRQIYDLKVPLVGICFGHQIIAQALGGKVEKFSGGWAVGATEYAFEDWGEVTLNAWHQDQITELPPGAKVVAQNAFCRYPALVYGDQVFTVQPHPEIRKPYMTGLIEVRGPGIVPDEMLADAAENLSKPLDEDLLADEIAAFFKAARTPHV